MREAEAVVKILTTQVEEAVASSLAEGRTGHLLRPPRETPQHLKVKLWHRGTLPRRRVVRRRQEPATS